MRVLRIIITKCDQWRAGMCAVIHSYCPALRATARPGECCHHPNFHDREKVMQMKAAGFRACLFGSLDEAYTAFCKEKGMQDHHGPGRIKVRVKRPLLLRVRVTDDARRT